MTDGEIRDVPVEEIEIFAGQSRLVFDEQDIRFLAADIKQNGLLQPGVAWLDEGRQRLILIAGERRLRAIKLAGLPTMTLRIIHGQFSQGDLLAMNVTENLQRSSLNAVERGKAFKRLMQLEGITAREVAARLHVSDATVSRDLAVLDLGAELQALVLRGALPASVAATLARLADDETRRFLAEQFAHGELSREGVASEVNRRLGSKRKAKATRMPIKLDGVCVTMAAPRPLTRKELLDLADRLKQEASKLPKDGNETVSQLRAS